MNESYFIGRRVKLIKNRGLPSETIQMAVVQHILFTSVVDEGGCLNDRCQVIILMEGTGRFARCLVSELNVA